MNFSGLLCVLASLAQFAFPAAIIDRDDLSPRRAPDYVLRRYDDTEPAKRYCKGSAFLAADECRQHSNTTVLVDDCIDLIRDFRGNSSRFEFGNGGGGDQEHAPPLPAVGFGTCVFSLLPWPDRRPALPDWQFNTSLGRLDIEQMIFTSTLRSPGQFMNATCGTLRGCKGDFYGDTSYIDLRFLIHNAQVDHVTNPTVNVTIGFPTKTTHSVPSSTSTQL